MLVLALVWLVLLLIELLREDVWRRWPVLNAISTGIWIIFIVDFAVEFFIAPRKTTFLKRNWLAAIALVLPALRALRALRILRFARGVRLVRVVSSINRGMRALDVVAKRTGFAYVAGLTLVLTVSGAAGMYAFERDSGAGFNSYGEALWWTAMLMTTIGSQAWPQTAEGRLLCIVLSLYALALLGYVTATLATLLLGLSTEKPLREDSYARSGPSP